MSILAIRIDSREPGWVKNLEFGGVVKSIESLEAGDTEVWLESGEILLIERKTTEDFLGSIKDGRLFDQARRLCEERLFQQINGKKVTTIPYLMITGPISQSSNNKVITDRGETTWHWESYNSALLALQEVGIFVTFARDDRDYERAVLALANRKREDIRVYAIRDILYGDKRVEFLMGFPMIGEDRAQKLLEYANGQLYGALIGLTDTTIKLPIGSSLQKSIRRFLDLPDGVKLDIQMEDES